MGVPRRIWMYVAATALAGLNLLMRRNATRSPSTVPQTKVTLASHMVPQRPFRNTI